MARFLVLTVLLMMSFPYLCECMTIDRIISNAMTSPSGYGFMFDESTDNVLVDMDMIFSLRDWNIITRLNNSRHGPYKRQAIKNGVGGKYWPGGIIYYEIDPHDFSEFDRRMLHAAMSDWMHYTCVQFQPAYTSTPNRIRYVDGTGCSSHVGMVGGTQKVNLAQGCRNRGVITHELGHVLGFHHEQTRPDRDYYVRIRKENIPDHLEFNFRKYTWAVIQNLGVPYDYLSIMHYGRDAFSDTGRDTIETIDWRYQNIIGRRQHLSFRDIKSANVLYNCRARTPNCRLRDEDCPGEGFVSKDCTCWCPSRDDNAQVPYYVCQPGTYPDNGGTYPGNGGTNPGGGNQGGSSGCSDQHVNCVMWAGRGECQQNPAYMQHYCRRACRLCNAVTAQCNDEYNSCSFWVGKGFCHVNSAYSTFMTTGCRKSCGFCTTSAVPEIRKNLLCEQNCRNEHARCEEWASRGECSATSDFMLRHCRKACKSCCTGSKNLIATLTDSARQKKDRQTNLHKKPEPNCVEET